MANIAAEADPVSADSLREALIRRLPVATRYRVAYSGGLDSHVLLTLLAESHAQLAGPIDALHVNHGLNPHATQWAEHCREVCEGLGVSLHSVTVDARPQRGESPEAAARRARYAAFAELIEPGDCLLTAHHQDDQAETVLLQLLRGSGPHGLAAMPVKAPFARGLHVRPMLEFTRADLHRHASARGLRWIDDPSNFDTGLRRNLLRHDVLPIIARQWPAFARTLARSAAHQAEAAALLDELAAEDLELARGSNATVLSVRAVLSLARPRQRNLLRFWLRRLGHAQPNSVHVERILSDLLQSAPDAEPCVTWGDVEVRRYRDTLFAMVPLPEHDPLQILPWDLKQTMDLPAAGGRLSSRVTPDGGMRLSLMNEPISIRYRHGGERCRPAPTGHEQALKKLLQGWGVPPWLRERVPLVFVGEELAAVADLCICAPFHSAPGELGVAIRWQRGPGFSV